MVPRQSRGVASIGGPQYRHANTGMTILIMVTPARRDHKFWEAAKFVSAKQRRARPYHSARSRGCDLCTCVSARVCRVLVLLFQCLLVAFCLCLRLSLSLSLRFVQSSSLSPSPSLLLSVWLYFLLSLLASLTLILPLMRIFTFCSGFGHYAAAVGGCFHPCRVFLRVHGRSMPNVDTEAGALLSDRPV